MARNLTPAQQTQLDNRDSSGQWKQKTHGEVDGEADVLGIGSDGGEDPGRPSRGIIDSLPYEVPDLTERQQDDTGLPADFSEAFDDHFEEAAEALGRHDNDPAAVAREQHVLRDANLKSLGRSFPQSAGEICLSDSGEYDDDGWHLSSDPGAKSTTITYISFEDTDEGHYPVEGPSLTTKGAKARENAASARTAEKTAERAGELAAIRNGERAPWSFLPATSRQRSRAENVTQQQRGQLRDIRRRTTEREKYDRVSNHVEQYEGMSRDEIHTAVSSEYQKVQVRDQWTGRTQTGFVRKSGISDDGTRHLPAVHEWALEEHIDDDVSGVLNARKRRDALGQKMSDWPSADDDAHARKQAEDTIAEYHWYKGWPGGDIGPQQDKDGDWHHLAPGETIRDDRFEPLNPR